MAQKWSFGRQSYYPYNPPKGATFYCDDMDAVVRCAECGRPVTVGECFTSRKIHTTSGMGYMVCEDCYKDELAEEFAPRNVAAKQDVSQYGESKEQQSCAMERLASEKNGGGKA